MNPEEQTEGLLSFMQSFIHIEWLSVALTVLIALSFTAALSHVATKFIRRVLSHDDVPLPSSSIFVNIVRIAIWCVGVSVILSSCFDVDVSAAVTALGIGGIAVSLGFQDTLSNLIGGLQMSIMGLVEPGDNIEVGGEVGLVQDVTWRHTAIVNSVGETIVIPNSIINKNALVKHRPLSVVVTPFVVTAKEEQLDEVARHMARAADEAAAQVSAVEKPARVLFSEVTDFGYRGTLTLVVADPTRSIEVKDAVVRAIAPICSARADVTL